MMRKDLVATPQVHGSAGTHKSMAGRMCMVTGASSGIGKATAAGLAAMGASVVMVCRDEQRGEAAKAEIEARSGSDSVDLMLADLSSLASVRRLAEDFKARSRRLHVLVNNAGVIQSRRSVTGDGYETTFAVNHLAPFLLTNLLLDLLVASAPARIVNVTSSAHAMTSIHFEDLQGERHYRTYRAYGQSKLANVLFTYELARRLEGTGVTSNCVHPGFVRTNLLRNAGWPPFRILTFLIRPTPTRVSPERGAETVVYLSASPEVEEISGQYFTRRGMARSSKASHDAGVARRLWEVSEELTGFHFRPTTDIGLRESTALPSTG